MVRRDNTGGRKRTADKRGDRVIEKREREEKRVTGERGGQRLRSGVMRGEWGRGRVAWTEERDREGIRRTDGQGGRRRARGVSEGDIPGTRRRRARVEKRVRAAHYARDTSRSSDAREERGRREGGRENAPR